MNVEDTLNQFEEAKVTLKKSIYVLSEALVKHNLKSEANYLTGDYSVYTKDKILFSDVAKIVDENTASTYKLTLKVVEEGSYSEKLLYIPICNVTVKKTNDNKPFIIYEDLVVEFNSYEGLEKYL